MGFVAVTQLQPGRRTSLLNRHMHVTRDADPIWLAESGVCVGVRARLLHLSGERGHKPQVLLAQRSSPVPAQRRWGPLC